MMRSFISEVAADLIRQSNLKPAYFQSYTCIFPNQRLGLALVQALTAQTKKAIWLPKILTLDRWMCEVAKVQIMPNIDLWCLTYETYLSVYQHRENPSAQTPSFLDFMRWVLSVLSDFNEMDSNLVNAQQLFAHTYDIERIKKWDVEAPLLEKAQYYLDFVKDLEVFYGQLHKKMEALGAGYRGWVYRKAHQQLQSLLKTQEQYIFVGFNALESSTENLLKALTKAKRCQIYWDNDVYYEDAPAGAFIKKYRSWNEGVCPPFDDWQAEKDIQVYHSVKDDLLAQKVGQLISDAHDKQQKTAVVLTKESLLSPVLQTIPSEITYNLSIGLPLVNMPMYALFEELFHLHLSVDVPQKTTDEVAFYHEDLMRLLQNTWGKAIFKTTELIQEIVEKNWTFISLKQLAIFDSLLKDLLTPPKSVSLFSDSLQQLVGIGMENKPTNFERVALKKIGEVLEKIKDLMVKHPMYLGNLKTVLFLFKKLTAVEKMYFKPQPEAPIQVMGMLETRGLDFERVIIANANEELFPEDKRSESLIPFEVKHAFNLHRDKERAAIFGYHFYRLLQRARNIDLLYNSSIDESGKGEKSRFIMQLEHQGKLNVANETAIALGRSERMPPIEIQKDKSVIEKIDDIAHHGFSPSALSAYIYNPLDYYQRYLLGIKQTKDVEEEVELGMFGTLIHEVLEKSYENCMDKLLMPCDHEEMLNNLDAVIKKTIEEHEDLKKHQFDSGKNFLAKEVARELVVNFIKKEQEAVVQGAEIQIVSLEKEWKASLYLSNGKQVGVRGKIDRIDRYDGQLRIVDYKTGRLEKGHLNIDDLHLKSLFEKTERCKALQALMYGYLYAKENELEDVSIAIGMYGLKNTNGGFVPICKRDGRSQNPAIFSIEIFEQTEQLLKEIIEDIYNQEINFKEKEV